MIRRRSAGRGKERAVKDIIVPRRETAPPPAADETFENMATTGEVPALDPESFPSPAPRR
jgi:hypothetical protein